MIGRRTACAFPYARVAPALTLVMLSTVVGTTDLFAQEDFRALDPGRPVRVTDAYPIKFLEWEIQFGTRGELSEGRRSAGGTLELELGLFRNFEIGVEAEPAYERVDGRSASGLEGVAGHIMFNFNQESWSVPAFAVRIDGHAPVRGDLGRAAWAWEARAIATRSFASRLRAHLNAGYLSAASEDGGDAWLGGLALDAPIGLFSRLIVADVWTEVPVHSGGRTRVLTELGTRLQITNNSVVDIGIGSRIDEWADGRGNIQLVLGISRVFGIGGFHRVPPWPDPRIH
ncbi:MAG: hypothetical protein L0271_04385 [Gemmatimonadetes bacterium]|nr:hypothetical protein [Gemmatimonadota bacterium]